MHINLTPTMALVVLLASACSTGAPMSFGSPTPRPPEGALDCAAQAVKKMGYTIKNETAMWLTAEKKNTSVSKKILNVMGDIDGDKTGHLQTWSKLTVSVVDDPPGHTNMSVTAWQASSSGQGTSSSKPTARGVSDANGLLKACAQGGD